MRNPKFAVPASLACPDHTAGCERVFAFTLRIEFVPDTTGVRLAVVPDADTAFLELAGHVISDHGVDFDALALDPAVIASWAHEQVWAAAHAATFDIGQGMRERGYALDDAGGWSKTA